MTAVDAPPAPSAPSARSARAAGGKVVRQLASVEARRLLLHPIVWGGIALAALMGVADLRTVRFVLPRESIYLQNLALPIGAATLLAVHLATTRPRRDDVVEVFEPAVHGVDVRIRALLLASLTPALLTTLLFAAVLALMAVLGGTGPVAWAEAATGPVFVAATGLLGVLLGRVAPWRLTPLFALVGLVVLQFLLPEVGGPGGALTVEFFAPLVIPGWLLPDPNAILRPSAEHLVYLVGAAATITVAAMLATRVSATRLVAGAAAVALAVAGGIAQTSPPSDAEAQALLARVGTPAEAGACVDDGTTAQVCTLPMFDGWRDDWAGIVRAVRQPLADHGIDPGSLTVAQRADPSQATYELSRWFDLDEIDAAGLLDAAWDAEYTGPDGVVLVTADWWRGSGAGEPATLDLASHVARQATGMAATFPFRTLDATGSTEGPRMCDPAGQAREAVSLWLAAQTGPGATAALQRAVDAATGSGMTGVDLWTPAVPAITPGWTVTGAEVALQLLERPRDEVAAALTADWDRWTDPRTPLADLLDAFGLEVPAAGAGVLTPTPLPDLDADGVAVYADQAAFDAATATGCP